MADTVSKEKRSEIMSHVTGKETKPEIFVRTRFKVSEERKTIAGYAGYRFP